MTHHTPKIAAKEPIEVNLEKGKRYSFAPAVIQNFNLFATAVTVKKRLIINHLNLKLKKMRKFGFVSVNIQKDSLFAMAHIMTYE